jgi:hypothetical protein
MEYVSRSLSFGCGWLVYQGEALASAIDQAFVLFTHFCGICGSQLPIRSVREDTPKSAMYTFGEEFLSVHPYRMSTNGPRPSAGAESD